MGIDNQSSPSSAPAQEVVPGVADDQPQVVSASKVHACFHVFVALCKDHVNSIVSERTRRIGTACRSAGLVGIVSPQGRCRLVDSVYDISKRSSFVVYHRLGLNSRPLCGIEVYCHIRACSLIIRADIPEWALVRVVAGSPRRNVDGKVATQGGIQSRPLFSFGPALIPNIALALVGVSIPRSRYQRSHIAAEHECDQYCQHSRRRAKLGCRSLLL